MPTPFMLLVSAALPMHLETLWIPDPCWYSDLPSGISLLP